MATFDLNNFSKSEENQDLLDMRSEILDLVNKYAEKKFGESKLFIPGESPVSVTEKVLDGSELAAITSAALDGWLTTGRYNREFELQLADRIGVRHALTVNSGSSANLIAFSALTSKELGDRSIQPGDEVITVAAGFPTTINPILQNGAIPVFVDVELGSYNIDIELIEEAISAKTKAIMLAHALGNPFDVQAVKNICNKHDLWLIEDCCDALGSTVDGRHVGTFGDIATLSFYPAHHITMGEGGAVLTNDDTLKKVAESFRDWGRDCYCEPGKDNTCGKRFSQCLGNLPWGYDHKYTYGNRGFNLKITDMQAACGLAQLQKLSMFVERRKENHKYLLDRLKEAEEYLIMPTVKQNCDPSWFGFALTVNSNVSSRLDLINFLDTRKIATRLLFSGNVTKQPYMDGETYRTAGTLANTELILTNTFWVGVHPGLSIEKLDFIANSIEEFFGIGF
jgi:CDP-6-deoxy-D-xylo-4-hexulose-3-dehydrase